MTSVETPPPAITGLSTEAIRHLYEIHDWRNASAILRAVHPGGGDEVETDPDLPLTASTAIGATGHSANGHADIPAKPRHCGEGADDDALTNTA